MDSTQDCSAVIITEYVANRDGYIVVLINRRLESIPIHDDYADGSITCIVVQSS